MGKLKGWPRKKKKQREKYNEILFIFIFDKLFFFCFFQDAFSPFRSFVLDIKDLIDIWLI